MDRFRELETFVAVADAGSFVRAAERLRTSKAAASRLVAELEARLGARLFNRTTRRLSLTEVGRAYLERGRPLMEQLLEADAAATSAASTLVGRLRVSAPQSYGVAKLGPLWGPFLAAHPNVTLEVALTDRVVDLVDEGFDMAVRVSLSLDPGLVARRLTSTRMVLCASPGYLARRGTPRRLAELAAHDTLAYSYWASGDTWRFDHPRGPASVTVHPRLHSNSGETCLAAALADRGVIYQPSFLVETDLAAGSLVELLPSYRGATVTVAAVYPSRKHLPAKVRALVDYLAQALAPPA